MKLKVVLKEIEHLISKGKIEEALEKTEKFLSEIDSTLYYEVMLVSSQYHDLKMNQLLHLTDDKESLSKNIYSLLEIIKRIKKKYDLDIEITNILKKPESDIPASKVNFPPPRKLSASPSLKATSRSLVKVDQELKNEISGISIATKSERFVGHLIDTLIFYGLGIGLIVLTGGTLNSNDFSDLGSVDASSIVLGGIFSGLFGMLFYPLFSGNLGHRIVGLKVVCAKTGENQNKALIGWKREFLKSILAYIIIPLIWLFFDKKNQNLYDKMTQTLVVRR